jgi:two-component system NtrC family sensor kinase
MTLHPSALLIVDGDRDFAMLLAGEAQARGYAVSQAASVTQAIDRIQGEGFDAVLVDLGNGAESVFDLLTRLKQVAPDTEVIVMSDRTSMAATIQWFDPDAFAFVRKSDIAQIFAALGRALERRRITAQNRRLVWELQTISDVASGLTRSLDIDDVVSGALQRLVQAMGAEGGSIRLRADLTGEYKTVVTIGPPALQQLWPAETRIPRPSDVVIDTRASFVVEDYAGLVDDLEALPLRSAISVPMFVGDDLVGAMSLASMTARRFTLEDQRLLATIAGQVGVAVDNARLHRSITRAKREWEQTFDAINDPIAVFNNRGELLRGNQALAAHLGVPITSLRELTCGDVGFCGGDACPDCGIGRALGEQEVRAEITRSNGEIFSVTTFRTAVPHSGPSVVQVAKNVTEEIRNARRLQQMSHELTGTNGRLVAAMEQLKSTQAQLMQAEKLSAIGHLVAGVAHELNNPLTSVIGYAQLVEEELREGPSDRPAAEVAHDLRRIADEAERAARIVRNLLAFARRQRVARAPQIVGEVCRRVLALRQYDMRMSGVELVSEIPDDLPPVFADDQQLQQVLLNLVLNAEQAMRGAEVKRLIVEARHDPESGAIELRVTDSGHGIETANLSRIFDPFFTTREVGEGTGLGLSICYGIVRDHGGHITVDSVPGAGTTIRVILPARLDDPAVGRTDVLVAHTEQAEREFIGAALSGWGYRVLPAASLQEALDGYAQPSVQIAILDRSIVSLDPEGWERIAAADARPVGLILASVSPDDRMLERFCREEATAALVPPLELRALHAAVRASSKECV